MRVLQINTTVNSGSTGRIAEDIGSVLLKNGHESFIAYGRGNRPSRSKVIRIGNDADVLLHGLGTAIFDTHGFHSISSTKKFIKAIEAIDPHIVALHNLHGYYLNVEILFDYLRSKSIPTIWTLFDCWPFTGHCSYFDDIDCSRWLHGCFSCPKKRNYPSSYFLDNSKSNYLRKKKIFRDYSNLSIVVHSKWLASLVSKSFLEAYPLDVIPSGIDLDVFRPSPSEIRIKYGLEAHRIILGCANIWDKRKGLDDFISLSRLLPSDQIIVLVGLSKRQIEGLPENILGIPRTESLDELAALYSVADVFVNPTWQDNFPTTNLEALACGTPVITYDTGGSPEALDGSTGFVIQKGNIDDLLKEIQIVISKGKAGYQSVCRDRAIKHFNKDDRYLDYLQLFNKVVENRK